MSLQILRAYRGKSHPLSVEKWDPIFDEDFYWICLKAPRMQNWVNEIKKIKNEEEIFTIFVHL